MKEDVVTHQVQDIKLSASDVVDAKFFYYRRDGHIVKDIVVITPEKRIHFYGKIAQQIFRYLPVGFRDLKELPRENRDMVLLQTLQGLENTLKLSVVDKGKDYFVIRVATEDFVPIPHKVVLQAIEEALGNAKIAFDRTVNYGRGMYVTYDTNLQTTDYRYRIWAWNYNDAAHGLKLGSGAFVLVCSNGLMRYKGQESIRIIHKTDLEQVKKRIVDFVDTALHKHLDLDALIQRAKQIRISRNRAVEIIEKQRFSKELTERLKENLLSVNTLWDFSQMLTELGTHESGLSIDNRIRLQQLGGRVLEDEALYREVVVAIS